MPLLEGEAIYTGGESWQAKFVAPQPRDDQAPAPYEHWHRTWHLHPGLTSQGQFETTAPVVSSVLLARPWDAPAQRMESSTGPMAWRAALEGISAVSDDPWAFELDRRNGKLKCLACCASARGECGLDTCGLKPPPIPQEFLARGGGEAPYRPPQLAAVPAPLWLQEQQRQQQQQQHGRHNGCAQRAARRALHPRNGRLGFALLLCRTGVARWLTRCWPAPAPALAPARSAHPHAHSHQQPQQPQQPPLY
jgi:hypothetical protein